MRDRVLYQAVYRRIYPLFDASFVYDSYASREQKGTHASVRRFGVFARKGSSNFKKQAWTLKCDIRKFFGNIDHLLLLGMVEKKVRDPFLFELIRKIVCSFETERGKGLPLGNVTSQILANVYLDRLDQFVKRTLKVGFYERYCDDFVILSKSRIELLQVLGEVREFLRKDLLLELHPDKVSLRKIIQGVDFLGYVTLPGRRVLRTKTKKRMFKKLAECKSPSVLQSYLGVLSHCKSEGIVKKLSPESHSGQGNLGIGTVIHRLGVALGV